MKKLLLVGIAAMTLLPMTAPAAVRFGVYLGPTFGPFGPYAGYGPYWGAPGPVIYGANVNTPAATRPAEGRVRLATPVRDAKVFIDGSYAGTVEEVRRMTLSSGSHDLELRAGGLAPFDEKIYVVTGKTTTVHPDLHAESAPATAAGVVTARRSEMHVQAPASRRPDDS